MLLAQLQRLVGGLQDVLGIGQQLEFLLLCGELARAQVEFVQFIHLVGQQLGPRGLLVAGAGEQFQLALAAQPVRGNLLDFQRQWQVVGIGVQQLALHRLAQQRLMFVLAVDVDQQGTEFGAILQGRAGAVDVGPAAPLGGNHAAQQAFLAGMEVAGPQPGDGLGNGADIKAGDDLRPFAAVAHGPGVGPVAQAQAQGIEHDGLAGAGLTGDDGHAGAKIDLQRGDDGVIADTDVGEHGVAC